MSGDILSDILEAVRLRGAVFFEVEASAPWVAEAQSGSAFGPRVMPGFEHVMEYHVITSGECWATIVGHDIAPVHLTTGDVVAFAQGDAHVISSAPGMRSDPAQPPFEFPQNVPVPLFMNMDGGGKERAHLVCGFLGCDAAPFNPLLQALPRILHLRSSNSAQSSWLRDFTRFALLETTEKRMGGASILSRLGELMFVDLVRRHVESLPEDAKGWLGGLRDRHVGQALNLLHAQPGRDWTLDLLARECGLSRSSFAERFSSFVGMPPIQYLQKWRLQLASSKLLDGKDSIAEIAAQSGYESEAAFSRAFKRVLGAPPAEWRSTRRASA